MPVQRRTAILLVGVLAVLLAGCGVTVDQHLTVRPDGGADVALSVLFPRFVWDQLQEDPSFDLTALEEQIRADAPPGTDLEVETVTGDDVAGLRVRGSFGTVDEAVRFLTRPGGEGVEASRPLLSSLAVRREGGVLGHRYRVAAAADPAVVAEGLTAFVDLGDPETLHQALESLVTVRLAVTLPTRIDAVTGAKATLEDNGHTVRWTLPLDAPGRLEATTVTVRPPVLWAAAGLAGIGAVVAGTVAIRRRRALAW